MLELSRKAAGVSQSEIRIMSVECEKARGINLAQGICDTEVPEPVQRAAVDAIHSRQNSYTRLDGVANLRRAIARKMREYNHVEADPEREVVVTAGSTGVAESWRGSDRLRAVLRLSREYAARSGLHAGIRDYASSRMDLQPRTTSERRYAENARNYPELTGQSVGESLHARGTRVYC